MADSLACGGPRETPLGMFPQEDIQDKPLTSVQLPPQETFPFMQLPLEIRRHVYSYIVPNAPIYIDASPWKPTLRQDHGSCCSSLLLANHNLYHELLPHWYSPNIYTVSIQKNQIKFLNQNLQNPSDLFLHSGFRFVTNLRLEIRLEMYALCAVQGLNRQTNDRYRDQEMDKFQRLQSQSDKRSRDFNQRLLQEMGNFFAPGGPGNLQYLKLSISNAQVFFRTMQRLDDRRSAIRQSVEFSLSPLKNIRVAKSVSVTLDQSSPILGVVYYVQYSPTAPMAKNLKAEIIETMDECLGLLEKEISGSYDSIEV